jgi:alpha-D-ribose 1-methylphosphonate 5-triphosphate synthase subunit PhnI
MYVAVKGGERAIENSHRLLAEKRRGNPIVPELTLEQVREQLSLAVDRVMAEGSLYDPELAALAVKQACGDLLEAVFLLRAYRTTLPRFGLTQALDTSTLRAHRRISAIFKDLPGGQVLGPTFDYTHRLLDFSLVHGNGKKEEQRAEKPFSRPTEEAMPRVIELLGKESLIQTDPPDAMDEPVGDLTRQPLRFPAGRDMRLQNLARGDEGFLLGLAYSTQRGFGKNHPFVGEIRAGRLEVEMVPEELGFPVVIGEIEVTECQMVNQFKGSATVPPSFTQGYGLSFGGNERKAMVMALVDRALRAGELGEAVEAPAQDEEFVLYHSDNVEASGFVQHLKLPHYVDFQAELTLVRSLRERMEAKEREDGTREGANIDSPGPGIKASVGLERL